MRILFLSAWFPYPPDNGSRIRAYNLMKTLSGEHEVFLVSLLQEDSDREDASKLEDICQVVSLHEARWFETGTLRSFVGFFSAKPRSYVDTFDPAIARAVRKAIEEVRPDVIVGSQTGAMTYVPSDAGCPVIFEELEIGSMLRRVESCSGLVRLRVCLTFAKHRSLVRELLGRADAYTCVSLGELDMTRRFCAPGVDGSVIPNGVDTGYYDPSHWAPQEGTLLYNGAMTYGANLDAVRYYVDRIYPVVRSRLPNVRLRVTGRTNGVDLAGIRDCTGVELTGYVQDIRDVLGTSAACIVPLREGGGSRLKILEAMAAGVPVVSTTMGAEGIDAVSGEHLLIADAPDSFADAIVRVLGDQSLSDRLTSAARTLVEQRYSWESIGAQFVEMVESAVRSTPRFEAKQ